MTYTYAEAMADVAVTSGETAETPIDLHAKTCELRQQEAPKVWRPAWDLQGAPDSRVDPAGEQTWYELLSRVAPRLYRLWADHERVCPEALDVQRKVAEGDHRYRETSWPCEHMLDLRTQLMNTDHYTEGRIGPAVCDWPMNKHADLGVRVLSDMTIVPPTELLLGRLSLAHTILYGDGEMGKGTLTARWAAQATMAGHTVLVLDYECHPDEWNHRIRMLGGQPDLVRYVAPPVAGWRGAIWDHVDNVMEAAQDACLVIIDSITQACVGADPKDDETATRYGNAIQQAARPVLSLGHVTKSGESRWPYGSVFWHNLARVTWHLSKVPGGRLLRCRKANAHKRPPPQFVTLAEYHDRFDMNEQPQQEALGDKALRILEDGPLPLASIVEALNEEAEDDDEKVKAESVTKALQRLRKGSDPLVELDDDLWSRKS